VLLVLMTSQWGAAVDSDPIKVSGHAELNSSNETIVFDLGSYPVGTTLNAELSLTNKTSRGIRVNVEPSCGCTYLSSKQLSAEIDTMIKFEATVTLPKTAQRFETALVCKDPDSRFEFTVAIIATCKSLVDLQPSKVRIASSAGSSTFEVTGSASQSDWRIASATLGQNSVVKLLQTSEDGDRFVLIMQCDPTKTPSYNASFLLSLLLVHSKTGEQRESVETMSIEFADRMRIGPSSPHLKMREGSIEVQIYLMANEVESLEIEEAYLTTSVEKSKLKLAVLQSANKGKVKVMTLGTSREEWDAFLSEADGGSFYLCIETWDKKTAKTVVDVESSLEKNKD
jgi:hypothetical protein